MNEITYLKIYFTPEKETIELLYDINEDKVWIDKRNLCLLSKLNKITFPRLLSRITMEGLIDTSMNIKMYYKNNHTTHYLYDNKVIKYALDNDFIYNDLLKTEISHINLYKKRILGKIYLKDGLLYLNDCLVSEKNIFFTKEDIINFLNITNDYNLYKETYTLEELFDIAFKVDTKKSNDFKLWAYKILTKCLVDGYYINNEKCFNNKKKILSITNIADNLLNKKCLDEEDKYLYYKSVIKYDGSLYDSTTFIKELLMHAKDKIIIISKYLNENIFKLLDGYNVKIIIYTSKLSMITKLGLKQFSKKNDITYIDNYENDKTYIIIDTVIYQFDISVPNLFKENSICKIINKSYNEFIDTII